MADALAGLLARYGSARHPERPTEHDRPDGLDDATMDALTELGAALEVAEDARGHLYSFHRLSGRADLDLQSALKKLREAGHADVADTLSEVLVGRDVLPGMWSFQMVEAYDAGYLEAFRAGERAAREHFGVASPHVGEAELKVKEQSEGDG